MYILICGLLAAGALHFFLGRTANGRGDTPAAASWPYPTASTAEVEAKLRAKGKAPWIEREKGMGFLSLTDGRMLSEDFFPLDAYEADSSVELRDQMPGFAPGFDQQKGKADEISRALEAQLTKKLPFSFKALAGERRVDVVRLQESDVRAYAFIIPMANKGFVAFSPRQIRFYYHLPAVLDALESFMAGQPLLEGIIWLDRADEYFMFVLQHKSLDARGGAGAQPTPPAHVPSVQAKS